MCLINWLVCSILIIFISALFSGIVIPQILLIAFRKNLFDEPNERKIHFSSVPRLGGIAFVPVIFLSLALAIGIESSYIKLDYIRSTNSIEPFLFGLSALIILYLIGIADDLIGVKYRAKFVSQIICGILFILGGVWLDDLHGILAIHSIPTYIGYPLTVLLVVFIINSINLIDGIDGLASGLASVACVVYGIYYSLIGQYMFAMLSFATLGVLIPFFYFNVFGNPQRHKKIFMGDTGSLTIGVILAFLSIHLCMSNDCPPYLRINNGVLAFIPLFIPCCDVVRVYMKRLRNGKNPFLPDKTHIHHKLLSVGLKQKYAMIIILLSSLFLIISNIILSIYVNINVLFFGDLLIWAFINVILSRHIAQREKNPSYTTNDTGNELTGSDNKPNYADIDKTKVLEYLNSVNGITDVKNIIEFSGAEKLRIYPLLFKLEQEGKIIVIKRTGFGAPQIIQLPYSQC